MVRNQRLTWMVLRVWMSSSVVFSSAGLVLLVSLLAPSSPGPHPKPRPNPRLLPPGPFPPRSWLPGCISHGSHRIRTHRNRMHRIGSKRMESTRCGNPTKRTIVRSLGFLNPTCWAIADINHVRWAIGSHSKALLQLHHLLKLHLHRRA